MKKHLFLPIFTSLFIILTAIACQQSLAEKNTSEVPPDKDPLVITHSKQLTFEGPRAGEGYFSRDGKKMIFQAERQPGNPFYQIYMMDIASGKTERVSPGIGKTTCAWVHPDLSKLMFSSTHLDKDLKEKVKQEIEQRNSPQKSKYSWSYDENFDVFEYSLKTKKYRQLTKERGYDAEGSYSPDGQLIAFASNRTGYTEKLNSEDAGFFKMDPSYEMEIYIMNADGRNVRRLTNMKGYDGGPFFSPDGKRLTWRHFSANGQTAEIWTMNIDGTDQKQITHLGAMSWAPYYHPSNDYIIFTTNKLGFSNFELYIVDVNGTKDPVRVSYVDGFDGLPVFSPDGKSIAWTHKNEKGDSQIFMADWDDQKARSLLGLGPKLPKMAETATPILEKDIQQIVKYLTQASLEGRMSGSEAEKSYTAELAQLFKQMGLQPAGDKNSYLQKFEFTSGVKLGGKNKLSLVLNTGSKAETKTESKSESKAEYTVEKDFNPVSISKSGEFAAAEVAFAGYGIVAPANDRMPAYDSYAGLDVKGKWVLIFRDIPENIPNEKRIHLNMFSRLQHKALVARERGAVGLLVANGPNSGAKSKLMKLRFEGSSQTESAVAVISITDSLAENLVKKSGRSLQAWQDILDQGEVQNTPLKDVQLAATVDLITEKSTGINVLAKLNNKANSSFVIGAHGDHLGRGDTGSSLAKPAELGQIHPGADDNASGVAGVIELAHQFAYSPQKNQLKQNIIFAVWSGEEIGILGSAHYIKNTPEKITSYLNMDMIGRLRDSLQVQGAGSALEWHKWIEQQAAKTDVALSVQEDPYLPTDSMAFYMKSVPGLTFFTGAHADYHSPRDTADSLNYPGIVKTLGVVQNMAWALGTNQATLTYQKVESSKKSMEGRRFRIYLGTIPDYSQDGVKGVKITGTSKDSPAEKAGLQSGDVIVELSGLKIDNLYDYVYGLQSIKANQPTLIKINRQGKLEQLSIVPQLKE